MFNAFMRGVFPHTILSQARLLSEYKYIYTYLTISMEKENARTNIKLWAHVSN